MTKERPILFSAPMVRALLAGRKTQTRRVVKGCALQWLEVDGFTPEFVTCPENAMSPHGQPGDRLWVKETWKVCSDWDDAPPRDISPAEGRNGGVRYYADNPTDLSGKTRASIFMPRWASRITLELTAVRVERLQEISAADAIAEGVEELSHGWKDYLGRDLQHGDPIMSYLSLWESLHGAGSWEKNPWVWVPEFHKL